MIAFFGVMIVLGLWAFRWHQPQRRLLTGYTLFVTAVVGANAAYTRYAMVHLGATWRDVLSRRWVRVPLTPDSRHIYIMLGLALVLVVLGTVHVAAAGSLRDASAPRNESE